jgi:DNA-binding transcriptional ArsR family regulator
VYFRLESQKYFTKRLTIDREASIINHMVEHNLNLVFHALADSTRRAILDRLTEGEATVGNLSRPFPLSLAAISKHLGVLERAGLVTRESRGRERVCRINPAALDDAHAWLKFHERFWTERLESLEALVRTTKENSGESR